MVATARSSTGSPSSTCRQLRVYHFVPISLTLLDSRNHPAHTPNHARRRYDAIKANAPTQVQLDRVRRGHDEVVIERVIGGINEQRVIDERDENNRAGEDLAAKDVLVGKVKIAGVESKLCWA